MNSVLPVCRSSFSLLYGTISPESLVETAAGYGYTALILADRNNLYGCYDFYLAARERGIKPIIAAELTTKAGNIILICENHDGFKNLSRLITRYQLDGAPGMNELKQYRGDLICIIRDISKPEELKDVYGNNLYAGLTADNPSKIERLARHYGLQTIACPMVNFIDKDDYKRHRLLRAIDGGYLLDNLPDDACARPDEYFQSPSDYEHFFEIFPKAVQNNHTLVERCNLIFPERKNILPDIKIDGDHAERLKHDALEGLHRRKPDLSGPYLARLEYELSVIQRTGFVDYFLIVGQIIDFCRREHIAAVGRGSAAGSLVSYSLGVTEVDPIEEKLYFERFLNEARSDCPDVDLDIDWRRRDEVLDFVYRTYGAEHVAMMASYIHFQPRLAIRECAKAFGHSPDEIERYTGQITAHPMEKSNFPERPTVRSHAEWERYRPVFEAARSIYGLPRHLGIHAGGIVITPDPITDYIPMERATKGINVTQCDMYQAEKIGLVKIDILGQRGLAVIADCYKAVREIRGEDFRIPENDSATYDVLRAGRTIGVFQIESPGMRAMLRDLKPEELNDITLALSLIRPGASESGMKKIFLDRFHDKIATVYPHKNLEEVLKETYGVFIYQEQVLLAAQKIAGFNLAASDLLRRAITKGR
ncbi:MAG: PHP domain-containing protein, partial [Candidatus Zixiibacteriota bacterium]